MKVLALETSDKTGSVAALDGDKLLFEVNLNPSQRSAQSLAPALRNLWGQAGWDAKDIDLIVVTAGPGSFTGLRVGVTTAKMLAYVSGSAVLGVNTLQAIAMQVSADCVTVEAVLDAQRQEVFAQRFSSIDGQFQPSGETAILSHADWLARVAPGATITGPGLKKLKDRPPSELRVEDEALWTPRASSVGKLGYQLYQQGQRSDMWSLAPQYFRRSAAEEKLEEKLGEQSR